MSTNADHDYVSKSPAEIDNGNIIPHRTLTNINGDSIPSHPTSDLISVDAIRTEILEGLKPMFSDFRTSILKEVEKAMVAPPSEDSISVIASQSEFDARNVPAYSAENGSVPEGSTSEKRAYLDDDFSDLLPKKQKLATAASEPTNEPLDLCAEFFDQLDREMPDQVEYGAEIRDEIAKRIISHFSVRADSAEARKIITERHKIPLNCKEVCVPKLRDSLLNIKSFNEYARRTERSYYNLQTSLIQATSCIIDIIDTALKAEAKSQVIDVKALLRSSFDGIAILGHSSRTVSNLRKKNLKPSLNSQYQTLCNPNHSTTQFLLGDDLNKGMQEAQESSKLSRSADRRYSPKYSSPGGASKGGYKGSSNNFLEKGSRPPFRHKETSNMKRKHTRKSRN